MARCRFFGISANPVADLRLRRGAERDAPIERLCFSADAYEWCMTSQRLQQWRGYFFRFMIVSVLVRFGADAQRRPAAHAEQQAITSSQAGEVPPA